MVLQRDVSAQVWGSAPPGTSVAVVVSGGAGAESVVAKPNATTGEWSVNLRPRNATTVASQIQISVSPAPVNSRETAQPPPPAPITFTNVLFGDVWVCGGQSNMVFGLGQDINASLECPATSAYPLIRFMTFHPGAQSVWNIPASTTACTGKGFSPFSAVCWYFGKNVFTDLGGAVPIGLVSSNVGGTAVERWSGPDAIAKCNQTGVVQQSNLWNLYIVPLLPMQVQVGLWLFSP